ncbi:retinol dehydrogenase 7 [Bombina bombina]|uniref:retinol dehydrogenase 7 n=1 Tax=Bombina bombina TaxID=8345 RepID=UPI00235AE2D9|nr:retinol dehydrogenase 7 [Bombina bombina]
MWLCLLVLSLLALVYRWYRQSQILENLSDKYVLITGCDSGFGNLAAKQLDRRGLKVLAACLTEKGAEELKKETSSRLQTVILDVADSQSVSSAAKWVASIVRDAGLWGLVNNAGIGLPTAPNEWLKKEAYMKMLNVNLLGVVDVTIKLLPLIRKAHGRIVNVSSVLGRVSTLGGGYCIAKYGVEAFSDSLRRELRDFGVNVSIVEPGGFKTSIANYSVFKKYLDQLWETLPTEVRESYGEQYYQKYLQNLQEITNSLSTKLHRVTDCMEHALTACYPWTRYAAGWDAKLFFIPLSYFPTIISDYVFSKPDMQPAKRVT